MSDREPHTRITVVVPSAGAENHVTTYERDNGSTVRKNYYAGARRVAMRTGGNTFYLLNDHPSTMLRACPERAEGTSLTSTVITTNSSGVRLTELRYHAYGGTRYDAGGQMTIYR